MAFKAAELVAFCESMLGQPYWYGTYVNPCTESKLKSKSKQYPSHYSNDRMSTYRKHISAGKVCTDCVGMIKGFFWTNGGQGVTDFIKNGKPYTNKYASNGCPDVSANGMLRFCKQQGGDYGKIATLPDVPGILLFRDGHMGVYVGGGYAIEARGFRYGVVKTKVADRDWTDWAYLPEFMLLCTGKAEVEPEVLRPYQLGDRTLKKGMTGSDVEELQTCLNALRFDCGTVDGDFGKNTKAGVEAFQKAVEIEIDGIFGKQSYAALKDYKQPTIQREHTVESGDSLWRLAERFLGSASRWPEIAKLNNIKGTTIRTGQVLKIPKK